MDLQYSDNPFKTIFFSVVWTAKNVLFQYHSWIWMVYIVIHGTHSYLIDNFAGSMDHHIHPAMSHLLFCYHCPASSCHPATAYHGAKGLFSCRLVLKQTLVFVNVQLLSNSWNLKDELEWETIEGWASILIFLCRRNQKCVKVVLRGCTCWKKLVCTSTFVL